MPSAVAPSNNMSALGVASNVATSVRDKVSRVVLRQHDNKGSLLAGSNSCEMVRQESDDQTQDGLPPGVSSLITQVTTRDPLPASVLAARRNSGFGASTSNGTSTAVSNGVEPGSGPSDAEVAHTSEARSTWKNKFRSLLCCLAPPQNDQYFPHREVPPPIIRPPPRPPSPAGFRYSGAACLGPARPEDVCKKTLVLDLDETLVHSSFKPVANPDYIIPVEIEGKVVDVYVLKRPWMDHFMKVVGPRFEIVVFTASLSKYADPLLDLLDRSSGVRWRLFRESCCPYEGNYVKDLTCLGRDLRSTIIVDNSPHSYVFQPENAVPIGTFIDDMEDQELLDILPVLLALEKVDDVREHLGPHYGSLQQRLGLQQQQHLLTGLPTPTAPAAAVGSATAVAFAGRSTSRHSSTVSESSLTTTA